MVLGVEAMRYVTDQMLIWAVESDSIYFKS